MHGLDHKPSSAKLGDSLSALIKLDKFATLQSKIKEHDKTPLSILLFCRPEGAPYVYCGRLGLGDVDVSVRPVRFQWYLLDHEVVKGQTDFQNVVDVATGAGKVVV